MAWPGHVGFAGAVVARRREAGAGAQAGSRVQIPRRERNFPPHAMLDTLSYGTRTGRMRVSVSGGGRAPEIVAPPVGGGGGGGGVPGPAGSGGGGEAGFGTGVTRLFALHLTGDTTGSSANQEIRVTGPVGFPFVVRSVTVIPLVEGVPGQFVQVRVSSGGDASDAGLSEGSPLFEGAESDVGFPSGDGGLGIMVPREVLTVPGPERVFDGSSQVKVATFFESPAVSAPLVSVIVGVGPVAPVVSAPPSGVPVVPVPVPGGVPPVVPGVEGGGPGVPAPPAGGLPWWATVVMFPLPPEGDRPRVLTGTGQSVPAVWAPVVRSVTAAEVAAGRAIEYVHGMGLGYEYALAFVGDRYAATYLGPVQVG